MTIENSTESKSFNYFWDNIFVPTFLNTYSEINHSIIIKPIDYEKKKNNFYKEYLRIRETYKKECHINGSTSKLSIFKIASIICNLFIEKKWFIIDINKDILENCKNINSKDFIDNYLINYKFAFYCGFGVLYFAALSNNVNKKYIKDKLLEKGNLCLIGNGSNFKDGCEDYIIKNIAVNDLNNRIFDITYMSVIYRLYNAYSFEKLGFHLDKTY